MSGAWVRIAAGGQSADLFPGCIVGRSWRCDLVVNDPRVSEVHAVVSLRGGALKLRSLRGGLWVHGMPVEGVTLRPGQRIAVADGLELHVEDIVLPDQVPALCIDEDDPIPLTAPRVWIDAQGVHGRPRKGATELWAVDEDWFIGPEAIPLTGAVTVDGHQFEVVYVDRQEAEVPSTRARGLYQALHIVARYDVVQLHQAQRPVFVLSGEPARLVSELAQLQAPVGWRVVAEELWPTLDGTRMRRRWDKTLAKLRGKLREANIRPDLVRSTGGQVSLVTLEQDRVEVDV